MILSGAAARDRRFGFHHRVDQRDRRMCCHDFDVFNLDLELFSPRSVGGRRCEEGPTDDLPRRGHRAHGLRSSQERVQCIDATMANVDVPLLILHGKADQVTPPNGSKMLYERARSRDKTLTLYGNMVHDLLHEPEKATVMSDIINWMNARTR